MQENKGVLTVNFESILIYITEETIALSLETNYMQDTSYLF